VKKRTALPAKVRARQRRFLLLAGYTLLAAYSCEVVIPSVPAASVPANCHSPVVAGSDRRPVV